VLFVPDVAYIVRRQGLRLLGEVLSDSAFQSVMLTYIARDDFLQIHMHAMRDSSTAIQLGGFHVFKIFVANPWKPHRIHSILYKNRSRLVKLLLSFLDRWTADENLAEDLSTVIRVLEEMDTPMK